MRIKEAVARRIVMLCEERDLAVNTLANEAGMPPTTIYSILSEKSQNPGVVSIQKICDGLGITITEFFSDELFSDLEQEIQ